MRTLTIPAALALLATAPLLSPNARAQQNNPGYFIPPAARPPAAAAPAARPAPRAQAGQGSTGIIPPALPTPVETAPIQMTLPPVPDLPALPKGTAPPTPIIGVLGVPEIMRASKAAQQVQQAINQRRERLNEDAQTEQQAWRELQQQLSNPRSGLSQDQLRAKEADLQARITTAQKQFRDRNRQIEEAGQFGLAQIERTLVGVIRQVSESRGINLVLQRSQVALNANEFDITPQVTEQLNKVLTKVQIPSEGVNIVIPQDQGGLPPAAESDAAQPPALGAAAAGPVPSASRQ